MRTVAFMSQKGGTGKSTLAVHTAVAAMEEGYSVAVIDTDPQGSSLQWGQARKQDTPIVTVAIPPELAEAVELARQGGLDYLIIDTPPYLSSDATRIAATADLVLIPCRPWAFDIGTTLRSLKIVKAANRKGWFVLSSCPSGAPEIQETREILSGYDLPTCPHEISDLRPFARSIKTGRSVTEFQSKGKAAEEVRTLWNWIREELQ